MRQKLFLLLALTCGFTACDTQYWWSRGQAKTPEQLLSESATRLASATKPGPQGKASAKLIQTSSAIAQILSKANGTTVATEAEFEQLTDSFMSIESELLPPSQPAFTELAAILRKMKADRANVKPEPFTLFSARVLAFLDREVTMQQAL